MAISNVRILGRKYTIKPVQNTDFYGRCHNKDAFIELLTDQDEFGLKDTLLHEIMHAILHQQGATHEYELEESFVRPLATGIMTVLQDNPKLAQFLMEKIK